MPNPTPQDTLPQRQGSQPPPNLPENLDPEFEFDPAPSDEPRPLHARVAGWTPYQQLFYGLLAIMILSGVTVYCIGGWAIALRPMLAERAAISPTPLVRPTLAPTPTQETQPTFIQVPPITLVATPTQAPVPTREPPTVTPTIQMVNGMTVTPQPTVGTRTPTPKLSATPTKQR